MTAIKEDLMGQVVVDHRTYLISYPYLMVLEIHEIDLRSKGRKTRIINVYDNKIGRGCTWVGGNQQVRRALEDVNWDRILHLHGRVLFAGDMNTHSPL